MNFTYGTEFLPKRLNQRTCENATTKKLAKAKSTQIAIRILQINVKRRFYKKDKPYNSVIKD